MKIAKKLLVLVIVPLLAVVAFAAVAVAVTSGQAIQAERLRLLVIAGAEAGELAHRLQTERVAAVAALVTRPGGAVDAYLAASTSTDAAVDRFRQTRSQLAALPESVATLLDRVERQFGQLPTLRQRVVAGKGSGSASVFAYRILIADLVSYRESMAQAGQAPTAIGDRMRAAAALTRGAEYVGLQQVAVMRAAEAGALTPTASQEFTAARTGYAEAELTFGALAAPQWRQWLERAQTGGEMIAAQRWEDNIARLQPGDQIAIDTAEWSQAMSVRLTRLREVEQRIDTEIVGAVSQLRDDQLLLTAIQTGAVIAIVVVLLAIALWLGRPMIRGLRRLRDAAHHVAYFQLPAAVEKLRDETTLGEMSPRQFADNIPVPVQVRGRDELAEVASAFNSVHHAAVRVAAEQALMRVGIAAMLVNLARRGMGLADRLTAELDRVERDERDPDRLAVLFRLDLLTMLLRRTNHSLLVLGGDSSARARSSDEPISAVIRAAQGQIEQYDRVEMATIDEVTIQAKAVDDLAKLLAELMDNACRYAPPLKAHDGLPRPDVLIFARLLGDRAIVQVIDEGVGIDPDRLQEYNRRMTGRPPLDLNAVRAMGLTVVAELAARHGITVQLRPGAMRGTVAEVTLPGTVFTRGAPALMPAAAPSAPVTAITGFKRAPSAAAPLFKPTNTMTVPAQRAPAEPHTVLTAASPAPSQPPTLDETMELPIFQQLASMWFTPADSVASANGAENGNGNGNGNGEKQSAAQAWQTPADAGWQAARKAAEPHDGGVTSSGLPKRVPKAKLVPGSVEEPARSSSDYRDPAAARATLSAYARGLSSSRLGRHYSASPPAANDNQGASA